MSLTVRDAEEYYNKLQEWIPLYKDTDLVKFWGHVIGYDMSKISEKELNCKDCKVYCSGKSGVDYFSTFNVLDSL